MGVTKVGSGTKPSKAIIDFLKNIPIFGNLESKELRIVSGYIEIQEVNPGKIVFKEGDRGNYVCFVINGSLDVLKKNEAGDDVVLTTLHKGRSIGEMSVIDDFPRSATIKARTKAKLVTLNRQGFELILEDHPTTGVKILKGISRLLSQNLRKTSSRLADYMLPLS